MNDADSEELAKRLDRCYQQWLGARAVAKNSLHALLRVTAVLATEIVATRGSIRGSFAKWCRVHCRSFDPNLGRAACTVAGRFKTIDRSIRIETWWLRLLGVVQSIHHVDLPKAEKARPKSSSWISSVTAVRDKINKMFDQHGGSEKMDDTTRAAIRRQLGTLDTLKAKVS